MADLHGSVFTSQRWRQAYETGSSGELRAPIPYVLTCLQHTYCGVFTLHICHFACDEDSARIKSSGPFFDFVLLHRLAFWIISFQQLHIHKHICPDILNNIDFDLLDNSAKFHSALPYLREYVLDLVGRCKPINVTGYSKTQHLSAKKKIYIYI